jgi:hypothetical protein
MQDYFITICPVDSTTGIQCCSYISPGWAIALFGIVLGGYVLIRCWKYATRD